jgi:hypothetical protein
MTMKPNLAAVLVFASLASTGWAKPPTLVPVGTTSVEMPCPERQSGVVCQLTQIKPPLSMNADTQRHARTSDLRRERPCIIGRPGGPVEIAGVIGVVTRYADISNAAYPVPTLLPDDPVCMQSADRLFGRSPIELVTNDPVLARSPVGLAGHHVKVAGHLSDEVILTSSQGPTFSLSLSGVALR